MMINIPNYQIRIQIYESANSLVYRGIRKEDNQPVILKVLKEDYPTPEELTRYQQEYEMTNNFNVQGIIKTYGIEKYENTLVIVLEDFGGESLKSLLNLPQPLFTKEAEIPSFEKGGVGGILLSNFLPLAIQVADTLGQIHAENVIHKDINPANIVWNQTTDEIKIIDFGISTRLPRENPQLKNPNQLEGSLAYISPEQTGRMNRALDYRTDLYSLGVAFYELLTGQLPFHSEIPLELVHAHLAKIPPTPLELNPKIPQIISDIIMKLMAKNAEDRYQSAFGLKWDLEQCLKNLQSFKNLEGFKIQLAQHDFSGRFQIPQKLYGREEEIKTLLQAFERASQDSAEMMLVAGYSGVGKSALVHEVHKPMTEKQGYFAAGKFDQYQRNIPYLAITQAFNAFCDYLLTESEQQLDTWRETILNAVGPNGQVLIDIIPHLKFIIGNQPAIAQVGPTEAQNRFNLVFQNFFQAISQPDHPLVLSIDDLQWADLASLNLLKNLMTDTEKGNFLLIGVFRDNEVDKTHPLMFMVDEILEAQVIVNRISLPNLTHQEVNQLISDTLGCEIVQAQPLTQLVYDKTHGNAFFTTEFLKSLYQKELLIFERRERQWQWNVNKIADLSMTGNVVELMANKIGLLLSDTIEILKLAACIGNQFDLETLSVIYQSSLSKTLSVLWKAIEEDLILPLDDHYKQLDKLQTSELKSHFKFQHDRVQQAAYSLIEDNDRQEIHLQIGRLLLTNTPQAELDNHLFDIVNQLNEGHELIVTPSEKQQLAQLNLSVGKKAKTSAAYQTAFNYFKTGIGLLESEHWQTQYDLTSILYEETAEVAYICTNYEQAEQLVNIALQKAHTVLNKVKLYEIQIQIDTAQGKLLKVVEIVRFALQLFDIEFPEQPNDLDIQQGLEETLSLLGNRSIEELINLPDMINPEIQVAMRILVNSWNNVGIIEPAFIPLMSYKMIQLSLKYGNSPYSAGGYASGIFIFCGLGKNLDMGFKFAQLTLNVWKRFKTPALKAKILNWVGGLGTWKEHPRKNLKLLSEAYYSGVEIGDLMIAAQSASDYLMFSYLAGQELTRLQQETVTYTAAIQKIKQESVVLYGQLIQQVVLNLMGLGNTKPEELVGDAFNETTMLLDFKEDLLGISFFYLHKIILCYLFQNPAGTLEHEAKSELDALMEGIPYLVPFYFYTSLARLAIIPSVTQTESDKLLERVTHCQTQMQNWAHHSPINFQHKYDLVEAEKARVLGKDLVAIDFYEKAITGARDNEYIQEEALAYELAAEFYLGRGMERIAQTYMREAHYAYQKWGAVAKIKNLEEKYPQWLKVERALSARSTQMTMTSAVKAPLPVTTTMTYTSSATFMTTNNPLDLDTIMKASQAISREIVLENLIKTFMQIVLENVGAEQGCLILNQGKTESKESFKLFVEAHATLSEVETLDAIPLDSLSSGDKENPYLSQAIVIYSARTQSLIVLNDASHEGQFTNDPYIRQTQPKSVLCFPILYKNQLYGLFYLENNLTTGAFTEDRVSILTMLSTQVAISLENAQYANHLEEKVKERTVQLAESNQQLAKANSEISTLNERLKAENLRMSAELDVAKQLQQMVLPKEEELSRIKGLDIAGFMTPADEVGGDYYDVLVHEGKIKIGIGDVTGHGLESGVLMLMVQTAVRSLLVSETTEPTKFLKALNRIIYDNVQRMGTDKNLTLSLLDYQEGQLQVTGQHEDILVVREGGKIERMDTFDLGFSVGMKADIASLVAYETFWLKKNEGIVLYTDGITEAQNIDEEQYGIERLCEVVSTNWQQTAQEIQQAVIADVRQFIGEQKVFDDITLLILKQK